MSAGRHLRPVPVSGNRAVLYVRVSAVMGREGEEFHSPAMQARAMRDLAGRRGLVEVAVIEDIDVSGRTFERAGIQRVLEMARNREIDVVALYDLSRLGRNTAESLRTIAELRDLGVSVASTVEQIDDTPEGQFQLGVFLGMAQLYSDQIGRRWRQVVAHRAEQGLFHGSVPPLGYRRGPGGVLEPDPVLGPQVRRVFARYGTGERIWHITRDWNAATGRRTAYVVIKKMLANPVYLGQVRVNGEVYPGRHVALVDDRTWRAVARRLAADARTPSRRLAVANPLAGLAVCDACDRPLQMHNDRRAGGRPRLQCRGVAELGDCAGVGRPQVAQVEGAVLDELDRLTGKVTLDLGARAEMRARVTRARVDKGRLRRELAALDRDLARLAADRARRSITESEHRDAAALLRAEAEALRVALAEAERSVGAVAPERLVRLVPALRRRWGSMTAEEKNRALRQVVGQVRVRRAVSYREPVAARVEVVPL